MESIPVKKLFLRDPYRMWYQQGVPEVGQTVDEVACWLRSFVSRHGVRRIVTVGNSGGGYAALVSGILLRAAEVHAFVPQARLAHLEGSHTSERIRRIHSEPECQYLNVRELILNEKVASRPNIKIYYCTNDLIDVRHVQRLRDINEVETFGFNHGDHGLVNVLKQKGILTDLQASLLGPEHGRPATRQLVIRLNG